MAKGNMFLGYARGKVGDVVMYRQNGEQVTRSRNRNPKNPRTEKQLYQRAIMATVLLCYKAGMEIFDHSFQGRSKGAQCQQRFLSMNCRKLRTALAEDLAIIDRIKLNPYLAKSRFVAPGSISTTPWSFIISEGTYDQGLFTRAADAEGNPYFSLPAMGTNISVAEYAAANNLIAGDIYTFVILVPNLDDVVYTAPAEEWSGYTEVYNTRFAFLRYIVRNNLAANTDPLATYNQLFTVSASVEIPSDVADFAIDKQINISALAIMPDNINIGAIGVIRSRLDADLRSSSELYLSQSSGDSAQYTDGSGLTPDWLLTAWSEAGERVGNSELILEGGGLVQRRGQNTVPPFSTQTLGGTPVVLTGVEYTSAHSSFGEGYDFPRCPVAVDANGNRYFIKCESMDMQAYGSFLVENPVNSIPEIMWMKPLDGQTDANTVGTSSYSPDTLWFWLFSVGISPLIATKYD